MSILKVIFIFLCSNKPICSFSVAFPPSGVFTLPGEQQLMQGSLLTTIPTLAKEWRIAFEIKLTEFTDTNNNIIHLTSTDKDEYKTHGDRTPIILLEKQKVYVRSSVNKNPDYSQVFTDVLSLNQWTRIEVCQQKINGDFIYSISIGGKELHSVVNSQPKEFTEVKVYVSSPWFTAQPGAISKLIIQAAGQGELTTSVLFIMGRCLKFLFQLPSHPPGCSPCPGSIS